MRFLLIYFSGTGNTELLTTEIKARLEKHDHDVETISLELITPENLPNLKGKVVGFGFPVYKFTYPDIFNPLFQSINNNGNNCYCFIYSSYARFNSNSLCDFYEELDNNKFNLIGLHSFKSPENGIASRKSEDDYDYRSVMFFENNIDRKLDAFVEEILANIKKNSDIMIKTKSTFTWFNRITLNIVKDIERTKYPQLQIDKSKCSLCGLCAKKCPSKNLVTKGEFIEVLDPKNCLHCLRCMHNCQNNAISFGKLTKGQNRYTKSVRDKLFKQATQNCEPFWDVYPRIIRKWRFKTLMYYVLHKNKPEI